MRRTWCVGVFAGLVLGGCSGDDTAAAEGPGTGSTTGTSEGEGTTASLSTGAVDETSAGSASSDDEPMPPSALEFARGIRLVRITANQGVQTELVRDGVELPLEERGPRLVVGRRMLLRGFWSLHADFEPRELVGRLVVDYPDGTQLVQDFPLFVDGPSTDGGDSFQWLLEADEVVPGMLFRAKILEPDPALATGEVSDPPPIAPLAGRGSLTIHDAPLQMKVVLVPILHQIDDMECVPDVTEQDVEAMRKNLEQNNAVQETIFTVREPMPFKESIGQSQSGFVPILTELVQTRIADASDDNVYYYGLIDSCDGYPAGLLGQAIGIPEPLPGLANERVSAGRWNGSGAGAAETFVHEVGHSQGRRHVLCSGGEAGTDPAYPHTNGRIGVWGFGIHDFVLRSPMASRDYMTYCSNEWVSDYGWEQTLEVIEILTSWDSAAPTTSKDRMLSGVLYENGDSTWWVEDAALPPGRYDGGHRMRYEIHGIVLDTPASIRPIPHGSARLIHAPLPAALGEVDTVTLHVASEGAVVIEPSRIRVVR